MDVYNRLWHRSLFNHYWMRLHMLWDRGSMYNRIGIVLEVLDSLWDQARSVDFTT